MARTNIQEIITPRSENEWSLLNYMNAFNFIVHRDGRYFVKIPQTQQSIISVTDLYTQFLDAKKFFIRCEFEQPELHVLKLKIVSQRSFVPSIKQPCARYRP